MDLLFNGGGVLQAANQKSGELNATKPIWSPFVYVISGGSVGQLERLRLRHQKGIRDRPGESQLDAAGQQPRRDPADLSKSQRAVYQQPRERNRLRGGTPGRHNR